MSLENTALNKKSTRLEVWQADLKLARILRGMLGYSSTGLFHNALKALCRENNINYDALTQPDKEAAAADLPHQ